MKFILLASTFLYSSLLFAGNLFSIDKITYDVTGSQKSNQIVFCKLIDTDRNLVSGCHNLNLLQKYSLNSTAEGEVLLTSKLTGDSLTIGSLQKAVKYHLDDMDKGFLSEVAIKEELQFEVNILSKTGLILNREIGCQAPFECDWNIFTKETKLSLEIKLDDKRLERVKLY